MGIMMGAWGTVLSTFLGETTLSNLMKKVTESPLLPEPEPVEVISLS